jgi:hypothetical protein
MIKGYRKKRDNSVKGNFNNTFSIKNVMTDEVNIHLDFKMKTLFKILKVI